MDNKAETKSLRKRLSENKILSACYVFIYNIIMGIKKALWLTGNFLGEKLVWRFEKEPMIIVHVDGGLGSQMVRAALGKLLEERGCNVRYELLYYIEDGMDNDQLEAREYELDKCFPSAKIRPATEKEIRHYKMYYDYESGLHGKIESLESIDKKKPLLLSRFTSDILLDWKITPRYFKLDEIQAILGHSAEDIYNEMLRNKENDIINVGVHVRRGDMVHTGRYWKVLKGKYFVEAIKRLEAELPDRNLCYYFFSNGFDFVRDEIIPCLGEKKCVLVDGTERDYEDFYLYCKCDIQVKSQGSWGMMAYYYNDSPMKRLVTYDWGKGFEESIYVELEEDMYI